MTKGKDERLAEFLNEAKSADKSEFSSKEDLTTIWAMSDDPLSATNGRLASTDIPKKLQEFVRTELSNGSNPCHVHGAMITMFGILILTDVELMGLRGPYAKVYADVIQEAFTKTMVMGLKEKGLV